MSNVVGWKEGRNVSIVRLAKTQPYPRALPILYLKYLSLLCTCDASGSRLRSSWSIVADVGPSSCKASLRCAGGAGAITKATDGRAPRNDGEDIVTEHQPSRCRCYRPW